MQHISALIAKHGLTHIGAELLASVFSCIQLVPQPQLPVTGGISKAGGRPDLPPDWPDMTGLDFLCQLNLAELAAAARISGFPEAGMLYFFYYNGEGRVLFYDGPSTALQPAGRAAYRECRLTFSIAERLPQLFIEDEEDDLRFMQLLEELDPDHYDNHQMLGIPFSVQQEVLEEAADALGVSPEEMVLLLQLDSDEANFGMSWGDMGMLYFCITEADLLARRFERVYIVQQSV